MKFRAHAATDVGLVRSRNEDSYLLDLSRGVFAVADGLGGLAGGDVASSTAIATLQKLLPSVAEIAHVDLDRLVQEAHAAVRLAGRQFGGAGIATTLTFVQLSRGLVQVAHVGDSFALLVRDGVCRAITREHNVENERSDHLSLAPYPPSHRYALTRVVGGPEAVQAERFTEKLMARDRLILATDGLTDLLDTPDVARICATHDDPASCASELVAEALHRGGHDNITVIVVVVDQT